MRLKLWQIILIFFFIFAISLGIATYFVLRQFTASEIFNFPIVKNTVIKKAGPDKKELVDLLPTFLGFKQPQTYLILFENNTEMRPGGGFIGTYATIRVDNGKIETLEVEGSEVLDKKTPATWKPVPPKILQEKLGVDRWYFRDSNWSPDFVESSKKALEFYKAEGGVAANEIDAVIAITPNVLQELLRITGPVKIQGVEFTAENVVRTLEHEVEYGFADKGIEFINRKQIIDPLFHTLLRKITTDALLHTEKYFSLFDQLTQEKHIIVYFLDKDIQKIIEEKHWGGQVLSAPGDYILWVDANLASLKTDHALKREFNYSLFPKGDTIQGSARMKYIHTGVFDKFTSRYRTYARVYVPEGANLVGVNGIENGKVTEIKTVDQGKELGKQWFGVFFTVEPKQTKELEFVYTLPRPLVDQIHLDVYTLLVQKQSGLENIALTLNLNFATNIKSATPGEEKKEWGDSAYRYTTVFKTDQNFSLSLQ